MSSALSHLGGKAADVGEVVPQGPEGLLGPGLRSPAPPSQFLCLWLSVWRRALLLKTQRTLTGSQVNPRPALRSCPSSRSASRRSRGLPGMGVRGR